MFPFETEIFFLIGVYVAYECILLVGSCLVRNMILSGLKHTLTARSNWCCKNVEKEIDSVVLDPKRGGVWLKTMQKNAILVETLNNNRPDVGNEIKQNITWLRRDRWISICVPLLWNINEFSLLPIQHSICQKHSNESLYSTFKRMPLRNPLTARVNEPTHRNANTLQHPRSVKVRMERCENVRLVHSRKSYRHVVGDVPPETLTRTYECTYVTKTLPQSAQKNPTLFRLAEWQKHSVFSKWEKPLPTNASCWKFE